MIAKHVAMKAIRKSSFRELVAYITDGQGKRERLGAVTVTNCHSDDAETAALEVLATQSINKRSAADKTYHLIVSFRPGEQPSSEVLQIVEKRLVKALGYDEHQRVSAVHHDTDNVHVHIAINTIHPIRYTAHTPYYPYKTMADVCEQLERELDLESDNHQARKSQSQNRADDMEHHAGVETLIGWTRRECLDDLRAAASWEELHAVLRANGLQIFQRGAGLVVLDDQGTGAKASTIARELGKGQLEARLGPFRTPGAGGDPNGNSVACSDMSHPQVTPVEQLGPSPASFSDAETTVENPVRHYEPKPVRVGVNTDALYQVYKTEQESRAARKSLELAAVRDAREKSIDSALAAGKARRAAIKLLADSPAQKRLLYAIASSTLRSSIVQARNEASKQRAQISASYGNRAWADWLRTRASSGDADALAALRAREGAQGRAGNGITGAGSRLVSKAAVAQDSVTKKGTAIHAKGAGSIRDDGQRVTITRAASAMTLLEALKMTANKYGSQISVDGTAAFQDQIVRIAAAAALPINFSDSILEKRRISYVQTILQRSAEINHPGRNSGIAQGGHTTTENGRPTAGAATAARLAAQGAASPGPLGNSPLRAEAIRGASSINKPPVLRVGAPPPRHPRGSFRTMLELETLSEGPRLTLPTLSSLAAKHGPDFATRLHWRFADDAAPPVPVASSPVDEYIAEREQKRAQGLNIPKHRRYLPDGDRKEYFLGIRTVNGEAMALLRQGLDVGVLPIDLATANRLKRVRVGAAVTITAAGQVRTKARSL